jgi:hypothetical protein
MGLPKIKKMLIVLTRLIGNENGRRIAHKKKLANK